MFVDPVPDPWCAYLEANWQTFLAETQALLPTQWIDWAPPVHNYAFGAALVPLTMKYVPPWLRADFAAHRRLCPAIARIASDLPGVYTVCLSRMAPGARVAAHSDHEEPGFLRIHLGLEVDPLARFRCEREWRSWQAGRCFAFHAEREHEVVHDGTRPRIALLVDVDADSLARHRTTGGVTGAR
ncbi:MAG: aspartyl/asparaginyl beta-hydroxylase domain-containing protein [Planctomycetes bacterium]|nr:aspartyl/asparaginyl beta-hydroxylase domain-containing protein [Planctomycetota bacterium]